jgi:mannose-1-phosphate guanylyltransferase
MWRESVRYIYAVRYAVILAGGSGKRLWPLSRQGEPKQLLPLFNGKSLLQLAWDRLGGVVPSDHILVCTGAAYAHTVREQLPDLLPENLLGEPEGRDSLNAAAWPSAVLALKDPQAVVAMLTADQIIEPVAVFQERLTEAYRIAETDTDALVTFGVVPTRPATGFGYLQLGKPLDGFTDAFAVDEFKEKPDEPTASQYVQSGGYWWNAGMFVWRAATFLEQLRVLQPQNHELITELAANPAKLREIFPQLLKISVDYAVMEPVSQGHGSAHVVSVGLPIDWADVGSFAALAAALPIDATGNCGEGRVVALDAKDNLLINRCSDTHVLAALGVSGLVVVQTPEVTLVASLDHSEQVKALTQKIAEEVDPALS